MEYAMAVRSPSVRGLGGVICVVAVSVLAFPSMTAASGALPPDTRFYAPPADLSAVQQIAALTAQGDLADARLIQGMVDTPQAVWFTDGEPATVSRLVNQTVVEAARAGTVPVLVAYNVPGRDCSQYSAGGAATGDAYKAWIDAFASGLGSQPAIVILEPDGLALLPADCGQPDTYDRIALIRYAVGSLTSDPNARVYLDAGHSQWHAVGDIAARLVDAGVLQAAGFFQNVSNFQPTNEAATWGTWVSKCIAFANDPADGGRRLGQYDACATQFASPLGPVDPHDFSTWQYTDAWYDANMGAAQPTVHFVIDTSRNGQGRWTAPVDHPPGDPQEWCNPPDRGLGPRPTADTGDPLIDAYLWVKTPGQSDGQCYRWTTGPLDPVRNMNDPAAGMWFPEMALELVRNADPALAG
jgi:endoglucanase